VIVDCTPAGIGERNRPIYEAHDTPISIRAARTPRSRTPPSTPAPASAIGDAGSLRVVSCNTTGLSRLLPLDDEAYGIEKARVTLVRRGGGRAARPIVVR